MRRLLLFTLLLMLALTSCSVRKLGQEIESAGQTYGLIKLSAPQELTGGGVMHVALYRLGTQGPELLSVRSPAAGEEILFPVLIADYLVVAFEDLNGDFTYQPGEPAQQVDQLTIHTAETIFDNTGDYHQLASQQLKLSEANRLDLAVDLSIQSLHEQQARVARNFLTVTEWSDPRFSEETVRLGLWEPFSFEENIGYGLYLLEPLDLNKQPVLFVHGINGSPRQFRDIVEALGDTYQAVLLQYPSGFSLDRTAYILRTGIDGMLQRYPSIESLPIVAHSMGGLVARGAIVDSSERSADAISTLITLATPWSGHAAARWGVEWSPAVAPVWRSMVPNSSYLQRIYVTPLPPHLHHHLIFSYAQKRQGPSQADDGVVTVKSQLAERAQAEAASVFGVDDSHNGILSNPAVLSRIRTILETQ